MLISKKEWHAIEKRISDLEASARDQPINRSITLYETQSPSTVYQAIHDKETLGGGGSNAKQY